MPNILKVGQNGEHIARVIGKFGGRERFVVVAIDL